jgi:hypothetical protein
MMKFMLMMTGTQTQWESMGRWSKAELKGHIDFMVDLYGKLTQSGELVLAEGLDLPQHAKIVKAQKPTAPVVSDGPFAETKEFLAGFWIVDVPSEARAIEIAAYASTAPGPRGAPMGIPIEVWRVPDGPPKVD